MRKIRFILGIILTISLISSILGCSSAESSNFEKKSADSAVVIEEAKSDQLEQEQTTTRKSDIQSDGTTSKENSFDKQTANQTTITSNRTSVATTTTSHQTEKSSEERTTTAGTSLATTPAGTSPATTTAATTLATTPSHVVTTPAATTPATTTPAATTEVIPDTIRVQISVDCINAYNAGNEIAQAISSDGWILGATVYEMPKNSTVYDLLMATGLVIGSTTSSFGVYINSIQSLAEFAVGGSSGWIYTVNGSMPSVGVDSYILQPGDIVHFSYTVELGDI
ncbi:MAG: DUF4430 domain-containing protein [Clostridiaceae bacterium]|nr:DUF4430 domain-containing protein [Clostridiaceae bacterium]